MRRGWFALVAVAVVATAAADPGSPPSQAPPPAPDVDAGRAAFAVVYRVLQSPRCRNCHPAGDRPLQFDDGRPHGQNISRRSEQNGVTCATCHRARNGTRPNTPPGAPHWHLPAADTPMVFEGKSPAALCAQLGDPAQTHGRDLLALVEHVDHDALVLWGWAPGPGRTPVPVPHDVFVAAMRTWALAGGPCPP
jgi:hypothetical protein